MRFVFITGVAKYARVSIFSSMSNLMDISIARKYADVLGLASCKALLLQTGYLTISKVLGEDLFLLDFPNMEVRKSYSALLLNQFYQRKGISFSSKFRNIAEFKEELIAL